MDVNFAASRSAPHQPSPYPFQNVSQSKPYDRMYKLVLRSKDATLGGHTGFTFRNVSVPFDTIKGNCRLFVSNFFFVGAVSPTYPYNINLEELAQPLSFDSSTGTATKTILTAGGANYENGNPHYGVSLQDLSIFVQRTLTISFKSMYTTDDSDILVDNSKVPPWQLTLGIIQTE
jgi:hypothetical protein